MCRSHHSHTDPTSTTPLLEALINRITTTMTDTLTSIHTYNNYCNTDTSTTSSSNSSGSSSSLTPISHALLHNLVDTNPTTIIQTNTTTNTNIAINIDYNICISYYSDILRKLVYTSHLFTIFKLAQNKLNEINSNTAVLESLLFGDIYMSILTELTRAESDYTTILHERSSNNYNKYSYKVLIFGSNLKPRRRIYPAQVNEYSGLMNSDSRDFIQGNPLATGMYIMYCIVCHINILYSTKNVVIHNILYTTHHIPYYFYMLIIFYRWCSRCKRFSTC